MVLSVDYGRSFLADIHSTLKTKTSTPLYTLLQAEYIARTPQETILELEEPIASTTR